MKKIEIDIEKRWVKKCSNPYNNPRCKKEQSYNRENRFLISIKNNVLCGSCSHFGQKNIYKGITFEDMRGKEYSEKRKNNISIGTKKAMKRESVQKKVNLYYDWMRGKTLEEILGEEKAKKKRKDSSRPYLEKYGEARSKEIKRKQRENSGSKRPEVRCKLRIATIRNIEKRKGKCYPGYNYKTIPILEQKCKELGITDLQHAENGGEFYIKELGYWVDGYSPSKNIVIEYYEKWHNAPKRIEKDKRRIQEIKDFLKCKIIIIREWTNEIEIIK